MKVPKTYGGGTQEFWMFDVGGQRGERCKWIQVKYGSHLTVDGQRGERCKWIQVFEGIHAILFLAAASDFDQTLREDNTTNRLTESIKIFEDVWRSRFLLDAGFIIFLNKQDLLKEKIQSGKQVNRYFPDYEHYQLDKKGNIISVHRMYTKNVNVTRKKRRDSEDIFQLPGLSIPVKQQQRSCFYHFTVATDTNNIKTVFQDVHTMIIENNLGSILN
uniref:G protein alpha subunit n=1 Tax=Timema douglasi TaxID=61478 RepID=A0A7R8VEI5_TIMDO|nr:unnamed protein product [Timema douglasi]